MTPRDLLRRLRRLDARVAREAETTTIIVDFTMRRSQELRHGDGDHEALDDPGCLYCCSGLEPTPEQHAEADRELAAFNARPPIRITTRGDHDHR